jgi:hypothetical protein
VRTAVLVGLTALCVAACGGGGNQSSPSTSSSTSSSSAATTTASPSGSSNSSPAAAEITRNWTQFFAPGTSADQKVALLQNGQQFAPYIQQMAQSPLAAGVAAQVSNVQVQGQTATVTYTILLNNTPALENQSGQAVLEDGTWKVGDGSFCALLVLQGNPPPLCGPASSAATASASG